MNAEAPPRDALHNLCLADSVWSERYEGWTELGRGGSAHVVRAYSRATGEDVALKIFHHLTTDDVRRFQQEVRSAQRLTSPYIVRTYSAFPRGSLAWIEMELVDGPDLGQELERRVAEQRPFTIDEGVAIGFALASALTAAHEAGIIHRDVKPGNILLPVGGPPLAKLGDFGISRILGATRVTATGLLTGTPQFAAPEVADGEASRPASDIYSLALTLFLVFTTNRFPFPIPDDASAAQWLKAHREETAWPLRRLLPSAPLGLELLLAEGLSKDPAQRPTAPQFLERMKLFRAGRAAVGLSSEPRPSGRLHLALGAIAVAAVAAGALYITQPAHAPVGNPPSTLGSSLPPAPTPQAPAPRLEAALLPDALVILNAGDSAVSHLEATLTGDGPGRYTATASDPLARGEEVVMAFDTFRPAPPADWRPRRVEIAQAGGPPQTLDLVSLEGRP